MNINRHNYEEFFILYMDNELNIDDRRRVELFVQNHPDLKEELDILLQYKLVPDTGVIYTGKEELMAPVATGMNNTPVTLTNYEEWMVLYADDELTAEQKTSVEQFITDNPFVKQELTLLQRSKLQPEEVVFAHKNSLYRKEEKIPRVPMFWWRAAAAVLLLAIGLTTAIVLNNKPSGVKEDVAKTPGSEQKTVPPELPEQKKMQNPVATVKEQNITVPDAVTPGIAKQNSRPVNQKENNPIAVKKNNTVIDNKTIGNTLVQVKKDVPVVADNNYKPSNNLPQTLNSRIINNNNEPSNKAVTANIPKEIISPKNALTNNAVTTNPSQPSDIVTASFNDDADFNQPDSKKGKLRGFFRKVTRTFEKRTNIDATNDDDKLLLAGLAIKLK